jgi:hypothetical protein
MAFMSFQDFSVQGGKPVNFPALPPEGRFTIERPQQYSETGVLSSTPIVQIGSSGAKKLTLPLELWGEAGEIFYRDHILPSYGLASTGYQVHLVTISWGNTSEDTFTGYPIGQAPTIFQMGAGDGEINMRVFDYTLVEVVQPRVYRLPFVYTTKTDDTILLVCKKFNVLFSQVAEANPDVQFRTVEGSSSKLVAGQKIKIPGGYL